MKMERRHVQIMLRILPYISTFIFLKLYIKYANAFCCNYTCLAGKMAIVTGANSGIGFETALELAKRGARVIIACRNRKKGEEAKERIINLTSNKNISYYFIDLSSLASVRSFCQQILVKEHRLDILINNAATAEETLEVTEDGFNSIMQINYFATVYLTLLLLDLMKKTGNSRIILVSSKMAYFTPILSLNQVQKLPNNSIGLYTISKLCLILFTKKLSEKLQGTSVTVYSLHPGIVNTNMLSQQRFFIIAFGFFWRPFLKTSKEGAQTQIFLATEKGIEKYTGCHFEECAPVKPYWAVNSKVADKLWLITKKKLKLNL